MALVNLFKEMGERERKKKGRETERDSDRGARV